MKTLASNELPFSFMCPHDNRISLYLFFSFLSSVVCGENDMRFVYCAVVICYILDDFSYIDVPRTVDFIVRSAVSIHCL